MSEKEKDTKNNKPDNDKNEIAVVSKKEYETLKAKSAECDELKDKLLRTQAEFDNARKRLEKEKLDFLRYANEGLILGLLPILDNLEIAEKHIKEAKDFKAVQEGVDMIQLQMQEFLKDIGIVRIKTVGEKFDPHLHDPIEVEESEKDECVVLDELKPGYMFNGKLLRPAMVKITKKK
jgi:molecular chaperone GrpE